MTITALPSVCLFLFGLLLLALVAQFGPGRQPLYDGIVVEDPYLYVNPAPGQPGPPQPAAAEMGVTSGMSPAIVVTTIENPPQAQLLVPSRALALPTGATSLTSSVEPLAPSADQAKGAVAGDVYRLSVTDDTGADVPLAGRRQATIILRAPTTDIALVVARWDGTSWQRLASTMNNQPDMLKAQADQLGEFALVPGASSPSAGPLLLVGIVVLAIGAIVVVLLLSRRSRRPPPRATGATSKRVGRRATKEMTGPTLPNKSRRRGGR